MKIGVLFLGDSGHLAGEIVQLWTRSKWTHVAIVVDDMVYEAIQPHVTIRPLAVYDGYDYEIKEVDLPFYDGAIREAIRLLGTPYGIGDCISGGLFDITNKPTSNGEKTVNCSEYATRVLRAGGLMVCRETPPDCITPSDLYNEL